MAINDEKKLLVVNDFVNENICYYKHSAFKNHKKDKTIFIETGTNIGGGIANALALDFKNIYTIEIIKDNYEIAKEKWKHVPHVKTYLGDTAQWIGRILEEINEPAFFWLDAHFNTSEATYKELEFIKNHKVKTHTILIDDMSLYFDKQHIEKTIREINPNYVISYEPTWRSKQEILAAYIP